MLQTLAQMARKRSGGAMMVNESKRCCKDCNELENILFKCNQEIVKQACKTEQLQQQLVAANQRAEQAEAQNKRMREALEEIESGCGYESEFLARIAKAVLEER